MTNNTTQIIVAFKNFDKGAESPGYLCAMMVRCGYIKDNTRSTARLQSSTSDSRTKSMENCRSRFGLDKFKRLGLDENY